VVAPLTQRRGRRAVDRGRAAGGCVLAALLLLGAACSRPDAPLQPVFRLVDTLEPAPAKETPPHCEISDDFRRAIGCLPYVPLVGPLSGVPRPAGQTLVVSAKIPAGFESTTLIAEPRVRGPREDWRRSGTLVVPPVHGAETQLTVPLPDDLKGDKVDVQVYGRPVPPKKQSHVSSAFPIGRGARLALSIGFEPIGNKVGAAPVQFRVTAESDDDKRPLLDVTLDPRTIRGWQDYEIDLAALAGQRVRFRLDSEIVPRSGDAGAGAFGFPLWGGLQVLEPRPRDGGRNVILISLDTMRGDQLDGSLGGIPLMPELSRRAAGGTVFEDAYAAYPSTTASHMTMLTGLYPATHGMVFATGMLSPQIPTLAEILGRNGYATVGVTEDAMLSAYVGFVRGFDFYREMKGKNMFETSGEIEQTFASGLNWIIDHPGERFFMFLHTYQVHSPYDPPPAYDLFKTWEKDGREVPIDATTPRAVADRHLYGGEVRYSDAVLNGLLDRLAEIGVLDQTIVVVTGDHGDEFGEHGQIGHAKTAYDEVLHVPLVFLGPGVIPAGERIDTPVSLVDLMPTLLDLAGVPVPPELHGKSLVPLMHDGPFPASRVLYAEAPAWGNGTGHRVAVRAAGFKWIVSDLPEVPMQVYDLKSDPGEQHPLDDARLRNPGDVLHSMYLALGDTTKTLAAQKSGVTEPLPTPKPELDERTVEKLRALGYIN
jgi:arylsulfatase A-like enzyme